jgi:ABC-type oligopeptide transport system ATPase subunit
MKLKVWITGEPGSGKSTVGRILKATELDQYGYHPDGNQDVWYIDPQLIKQLWKRHSIFVGIASNWQEISKLPWDLKIWISVPKSELERRYVKDKSYKVRKAIWATGKPTPIGFVSVDGTEPIPKVVQAIRRYIKC